MLNLQKLLQMWEEKFTTTHFSQFIKQFEILQYQIKWIYPLRLRLLLYLLVTL